MFAALTMAACGGDSGASTPAAGGGTPAAGSPTGTASAGVVEGYLVVADPGSEQLYVYSLPEAELVAEFDHTELSAHTGALVLPDGRLLFVDGHDSVLRVINLAAEGGPAELGRVEIDSGQAWSAVDPDFRYYAGSSRTETLATFTLIDLDTMQAYELGLDAQDQPGEPHITLGGSPLTAYTWVGGTLQAFAVADIVAGNAEPLASLEIGGGAHSQAISHTTGVLYTSLPERLDAVRVDGPTFGARGEIAWNVDGREGGRVGRMRLSYDGGWIYGALAAGVPADEWANRVNDIHMADLGTSTAKRIELARGIVGRFALSEAYALFYNIHPDGDAAFLLDVDPDSSTFQQIVATIPLEALSDGPVPGITASGTNGRGGAITPDGRWGFVSHGGDGMISIIDTASKSVSGTITTPTPLTGGGFLIAWTPNAPLVDTLGR